jgi:hypothetical protein
VSQLISPDDMEAITGYVRPADQIKWLQRHGWVHEVNRRGRPVVAQTYFDMKMGGVSKQAVNEPNFSAMPKRA